ncbi:vicilin-like seed storage protein At2g18540 [Diaphorina citri]|jgi:Chromosome segregation ATPases|uniref:Vicilin-like seed storage protein At2g18540 n=1 Tax=Diaphorina citri TaxID=121845 RepID=A0A1S3DHH7_DIACI|nr:vicilin-like seed storage protein At2g18540 [Diaphorina citri]KAI5698091.1 hypothetical protein M8J75_001560 [Diaphorina citri]KAI5724166.1 hypothetical protein M8J76_016328 [Diaphorina citri]KAI5728334.1 hypothetical protein M8J77_014809 [Diaphorina citri]
MDNRKQPKFDRNNPRLPEKKEDEVDQKYLEEHPDYNPGVWMRNPSSLSDIQRGREREKRKNENEDRIIKEEIDRYINDYNREKKESTKNIKEKIDNEIRDRARLLEELKRKDAEALSDKESTRSKKPDLEEEKRNIEIMYQKMIEEDLEKQKQLQRERKKLNDLIKRRIEEQDRLLALERKEVEERNKRLLDEERLKNEIERNKLRELKKQREELLKQELNELSQIEKHERKKKMIEEELKRSIREREAEKQRFEEINKKIEELRQREIEELQRLKNREEDVSRRRKELMEDACSTTMIEDDIIEVWPCDRRASQMQLVDTNKLCVDPISGKLAIRGESLPAKDAPKNRTEKKPTGASKSSISIVGYKNRDKVLTKQKYLELLSTYDPRKLRRKLSYQNWLINESNLDDRKVAQKFPGSDFSLKIDMADWPAIKQESIKRYKALIGK